MRTRSIVGRAPITSSASAAANTSAWEMRAARRRSEVAAAVMDNLIQVDETTYVYRLTHSKTDQAGSEHNADADKPLVGPAARP